ncbi:MAG: hypothetical protein HY820_26625 [Acidobacteria bacterium]|nr:hypothetical protein [Acidobacteriota bacterium]
MLLVGAILLSAAAHGQSQQLSPDTLLLARIKVRTSENIHSLPNFTCLETIERSVRAPRSQRFQLLDVLRLEVAYINRKEVFAWPGSANFEDGDLRELVQQGAIGNGSFALHVNSVFLSSVPSYEYKGETEWNGRPAFQFHYHVPMLHSGYRMRVPPNEGIVGYHGAFLVDKTTLDLLKLEIRINEIPPQLPILEASEDLEYERVTIGERDYVLPSKSTLRIVNLPGGVSRNEIAFSRCREFKGDSVVRFDDAPLTEAAAPKPLQRVVLPEELEVDLRFDEAIAAGKSAVGDEVRAVVTRDAKRKGVLWVPKDAQASCRILLMERMRGSQSDYWLVGVSCRRLEWEDRFAEFRASMRPYGLLIQERQITAMQSRAFDLSRHYPGTGILYMKGDQGKLAAGTRTAWTIVASERPPASTDK